MSEGTFSDQRAGDSPDSRITNQLPAHDGPEWRSFAERLAPALFWVGFGLNFLLIVGRLVDFPYRDEWDYIVPAATDETPHLSFLFRQHSDHFMATTHLQTWLLFRLVNWNLATGAAFNYFFVFAMIPLLLARIGRLQLGNKNWILWLFLLSILTPFNPYHQFGLLMVGIEHYLVLLLGSTALLFERAQKTWQVVLGALAAVGATYAVGAGAITSLVTFGLFVIYKYMRVRRGSPVRGELVHVIIAGVLILAAVALWFLRYQRFGTALPITFPTEPTFWRFLFALSALAVGRPGEVWVGAALLLIAVLPLALTWRELAGGSSPAWIRMTISASVLLSAMAIAALRSSWGFSRAVETWHYHGLVELLVPMAVLGWCASTRGRSRAALLLLMGAGLYVLAWNTFTTQYLDIREEAVLAGRRCVVEKMAGGMPVNCPNTFHSPLDEKLSLAKRKNLSFYRELEADVKLIEAVRGRVEGAIYTLPSDIDFRSEGNASRFQKTGWAGAESWATWTIGDEATLAMLLEAGGQTDLELRATVTPFVVPERPTLDVDIVANGTPVGRWMFSLDDGAGTVRTVVIPASVTSHGSRLELRFRISDPRSPAEFGGVDTRKLGVAFTTLTLAARNRP